MRVAAFFVWRSAFLSLLSIIHWISCAMICFSSVFCNSCCHFSSDFYIFLCFFSNEVFNSIAFFVPIAIRHIKEGENADNLGLNGLVVSARKWAGPIPAENCFAENSPRPYHYMPVCPNGFSARSAIFCCHWGSTFSGSRDRALSPQSPAIFTLSLFLIEVL